MSDIKKIQASFRKLSALYLGRSKKNNTPYETFTSEKNVFRIIVDSKTAREAGIKGNVERSMGSLGQRIYSELPDAKVFFFSRSKLIIEFPKDAYTQPQLASAFLDISDRVVASKKRHPADQVKHAANEIFKTQKAVFDQLVEINGPKEGLKLYCAAVRAASAKDDFSRDCLEYT